MGSNSVQMVKSTDENVKTAIHRVLVTPVQRGFRSQGIREMESIYASNLLSKKGIDYRRLQQHEQILKPLC